MAPLRPTRVASQTFTTASATRQGSKKVRKQLDEENGETYQSEDTDSRDIDDAEPGEPLTTSAQELIANMVEGQRKRHIGKKRNVIKVYDSASKEVEESINTLFNEHEEKSASAHEAQLRRLKELLNHKAKLEASMEAKLTALRADYNAHSLDIENVLSYKIRELK